MTSKSVEKRLAAQRPTWAVVYNIVSTESDRWIGTGWEFFDDEGQAAACYRRHIACGNCPTMRPFFMTDGVHLGAVHQWGSPLGD